MCMYAQIKVWVEHHECSYVEDVRNLNVRFGQHIRNSQLTKKKVKPNG